MREAIQMRDLPRTVPITRDVAIIVPRRSGVWAVIEDIVRQARSRVCPVTDLRFLGQSEDVCLDGESEYRFCLTYQHPDEQLTKAATARAHAYLLGRLEYALTAFHAMGARWREWPVMGAAGGGG